MSEEEKCREAFEEDAKPYGYRLNRADCGCCDYSEADTNHRWMGWQAAWNLRQQILDGWQLVPKRPTSEWIRQCNDNDGERTWDWEMLETVLSSAPKPEDVK